MTDLDTVVQFERGTKSRNETIRFQSVFLVNLSVQWQNVIDEKGNSILNSQR